MDFKISHIFMLVVVFNILAAISYYAAEKHGLAAVWVVVALINTYTSALYRGMEK
jgi:hypothetical protein